MSAFDPEKEIPQHIAIIMDGNGRWAKSRDLPRREGHRAGAESVEAAMRACGELGVEYLTLYAFSSENWKRPESEVNALMALLSHFIKDKMPSLMESNVRLRVIGQVERLPKRNQKQLSEAIRKTAQNTGLTLVVALSYGSREEIVEATRQLAAKVSRGEIEVGEIDCDLFADHLYTNGLPDPDLLIRTSGEFRISNFLLWQISYSEIYITDLFWPEFRKKHLQEAIAEYQKRHRRFGGL